MMQYKDPSDWVLATGESHSVEEFTKSFDILDLDWKEFVVQMRNKKTQ